MQRDISEEKSKGQFIEGIFIKAFNPTIERKKEQMRNALGRVGRYICCEKGRQKAGLCAVPRSNEKREAAVLLQKEISFYFSCFWKEMRKKERKRIGKACAASAQLQPFRLLASR